MSLPHAVSGRRCSSCESSVAPIRKPAGDTSKFLVSLPARLLACLSLVATAAAVPVRVNNRSPRFETPEADVRFLVNYTGYAADRPNGERRFFHDEIGAKALEMIGRARERIILSVFLFDSFYAATDSDRPDIVGALTDAMIRRREVEPDIRIALILDPSHRAYGQRESEAERRLRAHGIDVFYSDLLKDLKRASLIGVRESLGHVGRVADGLSFGLWHRARSGILSHAPLPAEFDGDPVTLETVYNAFLLKANHRKLLVTDVDGQDYEALVTSANPHNASAYHVNTAVAVRGPAARYLHNMLREDIRQSVSLGGDYAHWHDHADRSYRRAYLDERFTALPVGTGSEPAGQVGVTWVTERKIRDAVIALLDEAATGDELRIQMFYLSSRPVLRALLSAARRSGRPVRLLLDANKDSFNREKDGTPNRQVARYLLHEAAEAGSEIAIRWYSTHGEQNHAKIMSITNAAAGKYALTTGSCNWTGRNLDGVNMEANVVLDGAADAVRRFNTYFDLFWSNSDGNEYSLPYEAFRDQTAGDWKWRKGEAPFYYGTF